MKLSLRFGSRASITLAALAALATTSACAHHDATAARSPQTTLTSTQVQLDRDRVSATPTPTAQGDIFTPDAADSTPMDDSVAIDAWAKRYPDASAELNDWMGHYPTAAKKLAAWDASHPTRMKTLTDWAITHRIRGRRRVPVRPLGVGRVPRHRAVGARRGRRAPRLGPARLARRRGAHQPRGLAGLGKQEPEGAPRPCPDAGQEHRHPGSGRAGRLRQARQRRDRRTRRRVALVPEPHVDDPLRSP